MAPAWASTMREREALVDAGIMPTSAHSAPSKLSRRRARWHHTQAVVQFQLLVEHQHLRLLTKAMSKTSSTSACPWRSATAIQGTPPSRATAARQRHWAARRQQTHPQACAPDARHGHRHRHHGHGREKSGMRGQRPRSHQARAATLKRYQGMPGGALIAQCTAAKAVAHLPQHHGKPDPGRKAM